MGSGDKLQLATPLNSHRQDWEFFPFLPGRGAVSAGAAGVSRYTFWIDYDPFDISNRQLITQNFSFQVFIDSGLVPITPLIIADQSNDIPDEVVEQATLGLPTGGSVSLARASITQPNVPAQANQPPYFIDTLFTSQPRDSNYQNDQGYYSIAGWKGFGIGFGVTNMFAQAFVPMQPQLTGLYWQNIFHTNTPDHTTYEQVNFELWTGTGFYAHIGGLLPKYNPALGSNGFITDGTCEITCDDFSYLTGDDGNIYWTTLEQPSIRPNAPISMTPGQTYYLVVRLATLTASTYYFLGTNTTASGLYSGTGRYIFGSAYSAPDGVASYSQIVDANGTAINFPFITQGNVGRTAITFWWANIANGSSNWWFGTPTTNEFKFIHLSYNQRI